MLNGSISYNDLRDYYEESGQDDWLADYLVRDYYEESGQDDWLEDYLVRDYYEESGQDDWLEDYLAAREALRDFD